MRESYIDCAGSDPAFFVFSASSATTSALPTCLHRQNVPTWYDKNRVAEGHTAFPSDNLFSTPYSGSVDTISPATKKIVTQHTNAMICSGGTVHPTAAKHAVNARLGSTVLKNFFMSSIFHFERLWGRAQVGCLLQDLAT